MCYFSSMYDIQDKCDLEARENPQTRDSDARSWKSDPFRSQIQTEMLSSAFESTHILVTMLLCVTLYL